MHSVAGVIIRRAELATEATILDRRVEDEATSIHLPIDLPFELDAPTSVRLGTGAEDAATALRRPIPRHLSPVPLLAPRRAEHRIAPGERVGKYELLHTIAQGTFGLVVRARDTSLDREVALKLLHPIHLANRDIVQRFLQEARAATRITHPAIVTVFDCDRYEGGAYIAMELLRGESLSARLSRHGRLPPDVAVELVRQIASALEAAHRADVIHRDLKPDNIHLVPDPAMPSGERIKVLDFGLAKLGDANRTMMTHVFGTPRYMSPEQCRSTTQIDQRSDVYALGCILFELVTGKPPFEGSLQELLERHQRAPIPRARLAAPECSAELDDLIHRMLAKDPTGRPPTMGSLQSMLQRIGPRWPVVAAGQPGARVVGSAVEPRVPTRRHGPILAAAIAFVVAGVITAIATGGPSTIQTGPVPSLVLTKG